VVAQFLGLKLRLMGNAFRRSPWQVFGLVVGLLYGVAITIVVVGVLVAARLIPDISSLHSTLVVIGSIVVAGFAVLPLIFGVDDTLDPRKFALFGLPNRQLSTGLALAALIGVPSVVLIVCTSATVVTWSRDPGTTLLAVISFAVIVATCVLVSRVTTSMASFLLATRRSREFGGVIGILVIVLLAPVAFLLLTIDWGRDGLRTVTGFASWLAWTPLGAAWSVPGEAAQGNGGAAILQLLIALATVGLLWLAWTALVAKMLVTPSREAEAKAYAGLGWFGRLRGGPTAAIAARSMTYWVRDPRYWVSLVLIPLVPAFVIVALTLGGIPAHYASLVPLPLVCLFLGWTIHNDIAFDNTAIWLHIVSGTRGIADRVGRMFPPILIGIPVITIGSLVTTAVYGDWVILPTVASLSGAILLIGIGLSSVASALFPYPATKPGDSAFAQPQTSGASAALVQALSFFAIVLLASPIIVFLVLGLTVSPLWLGVAPVAGVVLGFGCLFGGLYLGAWAFNRRQPELMAFANRND
jgi:ABC-2 type transport system permease protein